MDFHWLRQAEHLVETKTMPVLALVDARDVPCEARHRYRLVPSWTILLLLLPPSANPFYLCLISS